MGPSPLYHPPGSSLSLSLLHSLYLDQSLPPLSLPLSTILLPRVYYGRTPLETEKGEIDLMV